MSLNSTAIGYVMAPMNWPALIMLIIGLVILIAFLNVILKTKGEKK